MFVLVVVYYLPFKDIKDSVVADDEFGRVIFAAWDIVPDALAWHLEFNQAEIQGFNHANNGKNSQTNLTACCVGGKRKVVCQEQITRSCTRACVINMWIAKI